MAKKNAYDEARDLFGRVGAGTQGLYNQARSFVQQNPTPAEFIGKQIQNRIVQPAAHFVQQYPSPATLPIPKPLATLPGGEYVPTTVGKYVSGIEPPRALRQVPQFLARAGTSAFNLSGSAIMANPQLMGAQTFIKPTIKGAIANFGIGAATNIAEQYADSGKINPNQAITSGLLAAPFSFVGTTERKVGKSIESYLPKARNAEELSTFQYIKKNLGQAVNNYIQRTRQEFGTDNIISSDEGKYIIPGFTGKNAPNFHEAASGLAKYLYDSYLATRKNKGNNTVLFMSGGTGSGKTTALRNAGVEFQQYPIVYDTNLSGIKNSIGKIKKALDNGFKVEIAYVQRDPITAFEQGVLPRVKSRGRIVSIDEHISRHQGALQTLQNLQKKFGDQIRVSFIDNTGQAGDAREVPFDKLPKFLYNTPVLKKALYEKLKISVENGQISPEEANAISGKEIFRSEIGGQPKPKPSQGILSTPVSSLAENKYAFNINKERLNISPEQKAVVQQTVDSLKPTLEKVKGKTLSNEEVVKSAQWSTPLRKIVPKEQTQEMLGRLTKLRQEVAAGAQGKGVSADFIENLKVLSSFAADTGRRLQAFSIHADPAISGIKEEIVQHLLKLGKNTDEIIVASQNVDFNNLKEVTKFYRSFVKLSATELIDEYRYINLLSSPQTHIVNAFSNLLQGSVVAPGTHLFSGAADAVGSLLTGRERTQYVREVPAYARGAVSSLGEAFSKFSDALKGNILMSRPDVARIPTGNKLLQPLQIIPRLLEASDVFFRTIVQKGELEALAYRAQRQGKFIAPDVLNSEAAKKASYYVFHKPLDPSNATGQGTVLSSIDKLTQAVYSLRNVPGVKWFIPFVQTPMNILKQGIEYSPLGITTLPGATNKTEQLGKTLMGSMVFTGAGSLILNTDSTWSAPTSKNQKEAFYSTGRQPYSIKLGDQWVSYSRLGPLAYPIAMAAALKYYTQQDPKAFEGDRLKQVGKAMGGLAKFFSDQSYVQGIGNLVKTIQGDPTAVKDLIASIPAQSIPLSSLVAWVARIVDPVYRKPGGFLESIEARIPGLSTQVPPYTNMLGEPSQRDKPLLNALSPVAMSTGEPKFEQAYQQEVGKPEETAAKKEAIKLFLTGNTDDAAKIMKKHNISLTKEDIKTYRQNRLREAADLYVRNNEDGAVAIMKENGIPLSPLDIKKSAKKYAAELYKKGFIDEAVKIMRTHGIILTKKDII